jgi:hypothetical protein
VQSRLALEFIQFKPVSRKQALFKVLLRLLSSLVLLASGKDCPYHSIARATVVGTFPNTIDLGTFLWLVKTLFLQLTIYGHSFFTKIVVVGMLTTRPRL